jgi:hypothetical protein
MKPEYKYLMRTTYRVALPRGMLMCARRAGRQPPQADSQAWCVRLSREGGKVPPACFNAKACTTIDMSTYEDEYLYAELETNNPKQVTLTVDNRSGSEFTLETRAFYRFGGGESPLTPVSETESGNALPRMFLAPGSRQSRNFAAEQALSLRGGKQSIGDWVPKASSGLEFSFVYRLGGEERSLVFPDHRERVLVGRVQVAVDIPLPFLKTIAERRLKVYEAALAQARISFGAEGRELRLVNLRYSSKTTGFVENALLNADIIAVEN